MSNGLYPDQNIRSVGTEQGPNYLQMLSAEKESVGKIQKRLNTNERCEAHQKDDVKYTNDINLKKRKQFDNYTKKVPSKFRSRYA